MFVHGGGLPILGNMWFLWVFGDAKEDLNRPTANRTVLHRWN
jgi:hypothetical protein